MTKRSSLFARFDLDYADHPKIAPLSDAAFRAHVEMILYARRYLTDGRIAKRIANRWGTESVTELLTNDPERPSLIELDDGDYLLHEYDEMQETRAEVERRKSVNRENGRLGGRPAKRNKTQSVSDSGTETRTENRTEMKAETETETETEETLTSENASVPEREDVTALLDLLDHEIEANGNRPPKRNKSNHDAIRLLLDRDNHTPEQIAYVIRWAQADTFWKANILSATKLREKFGQLVAKIRADHERTHRPSEKEQRNHDILARFAAQDDEPEEIFVEGISA